MKARWEADDLKGKMARAGTLVVMEKLRNLAAVGTCAVTAVLLLVAGVNLLSGAGTAWPKTAIAAAAEAYRVARACTGTPWRL